VCVCVNDFSMVLSCDIGHWARPRPAVPNYIPLRIIDGDKSGVYDVIDAHVTNGDMADAAGNTWRRTEINSWKHRGHIAKLYRPKLIILIINAHFIPYTISERELTFTFAICYRPSVCRLSSVTLVHPTQAVQIFGNISTAFGTLANR